MFIAVKNIWMTSNSIIIDIIIAVFYCIIITALLYGTRKHTITEIVKNPSMLMYTLLILIESVYYAFLTYFPNIILINDLIIFSIEAVIFITAVIISLIDDKFYANTFPVTICRIATFILGLSFVLLIIKYIIIVLMVVGFIIIIITALWAIFDFNTFKKILLFWRKKT